MGSFWGKSLDRMAPPVTQASPSNLPIGSSVGTVISGGPDRRRQPKVEDLHQPRVDGISSSLHTAQPRNSSCNCRFGRFFKAGPRSDPKRNRS